MPKVKDHQSTKPNDEERDQGTQDPTIMHKKGPKNHNFDLNLENLLLIRGRYCFRKLTSQTSVKNFRGRNETKNI